MMLFSVIFTSLIQGHYQWRHSKVWYNFLKLMIYFNTVCL